MLRSLAVLGLIAAITVPASPVALADEAAEEATVAFAGAGWGHGVGLSQYGAYGASRDGWTVDQILNYFYQGTTIETMGEGTLTVPETLWVNLERDRSSLVLIARETALAPPEPVVVSRDGVTWELGKDQRVVFDWNSAAGTCDLEIQDAAGVPLATPGAGPCDVDISWDGWVEQPSRKIEIAGCTNANWNTIPTSYPACQYARGDLHLRVGPGGMDLSVEMDIDDYVLGISEMPYYWGLDSNTGLEALKAQAIAARSYARELQLYRDEVGNNSCAAWCHVRDTTFDQRYVGWGHGGIGQDEWIEAVNATDGQVLTHPDAPTEGIVRAYYFSSTGGATENINEIWSGWDERAYYASVADAWSLDPKLNINNASWTASFSVTYVAGRVGLDSLQSVAVTERNTSTSANTVRFAGLKNGVSTTVDWGSASVKSVFGLKSIYFDVAFGEVSPFSDIVGSVHYEDIVYIADAGITKGCNPPENTDYCPSGHVTRGEMAAFLVRSLGLADDGGKDWFTDDDGSVFEADINKVATAGITVGCNAEGTNYCPDDDVTRGEMAAFLVRGFSYDDPGEGNWFTDDDESIFENAIDRLRVAGVTLGCNPPTNDRFCPDDLVQRDQMASFLARALRDLI